MQPRRRRDDRGFTMMEMTVVGLVASVALVIAGDGMVSLQKATTRTTATVAEQQAASTAMAQLERDIRSTASLSIPSGATAADELQLAVIAVDGTTTNVRWVYDPVAQTLSRQVQSGSSWPTSGYAVTPVTNGTGTAVFTYYDFQGNDISTTTTSNLVTCTTAIKAVLDLTPSVNGAAPFQDTAEVALTNELAVLTAPGNGQCGSSS